MCDLLRVHGWGWLGMGGDGRGWVGMDIDAPVGSLRSFAHFPSGAPLPLLLQRTQLVALAHVGKGFTRGGGMP
jgi:hypothetical protein